MLASATLFIFSLLATGAAQGETKDRALVVVGGDRSYPPYEFIDRDGNPSGYNVGQLETGTARGKTAMHKGLSGNSRARRKQCG